MVAATNFSKNDLAALELAMQQAGRDPGRKQQLDAKLLDESWVDVAAFAAYCEQKKTLQLDLADTPPCWIDDPDETLKGPNDDAWYYGAHAAARLLQRMQAAGISRYHPDPVAALDAAKRKKV